LVRNRRDEPRYREFSYESQTISYEPQTVGLARTAIRPASIQRDPMWDRWLDG
jgi:hypothetical protein